MQKAITYQKLSSDANGNPRYVAQMLLQYGGDVMLHVVDKKLTKIIGRYSEVHHGYIFSTYGKPEDELQKFFNAYWGE